MNDLLTLRQAATLTAELAATNGTPALTLSGVKAAATNGGFHTFKIGDGKTSPRYVTRVDFVAWLNDDAAHRRGAKRKEKENGER